MSEPVPPDGPQPDASASGDGRARAQSAEDNRILGPEADLGAYETGTRGESGDAAFVMRPTTTEGVSAAVACCFRQGIPFVTQSANTGLVGASVPDASGRQAVLSMERLNTTCQVDVDNRSVRVGAGVRLSELNARLEREGLWFPIDLGADPMIGGMVASNTGGARFLRYGDVRANTLGLTVVLPDSAGTVLRLDTDLRKNNTGPDWKQLFIGTGGSFGVVTECVLNVEPLPARQATALLVPSSEDTIFELLRQLEHRLGRRLSAFELISGNAIRHALAHAPALRNPFSGGEVPATALLVEIAETDSAQADEPPLEAVLERTLAEVWERPDAPLADALFGPPEEIWPLRHAVSEGVKHAGHLFAFDLAFRRPDVITFRSVMREKLAEDWPELEVCDFGHVADGGLHFNLVCTDPSRCEADDYEQRLRQTVLDCAVRTFGGSFSAEHGVGPKNQRDYDRYTPDVLKTLADRLGAALELHPAGAARFGHGPDHAGGATQRHRPGRGSTTSACRNTGETT